ncbi:MAG TPA: transglycosylase domain-containing protein [Virgibacillus sp.]|nr:transglycosylase domain-containing protein [Virgibacillus sp.]
MNDKKWKDQLNKKIKASWSTGKLQRSSRITYDVFWNVILFFIIIGMISLFLAVGIGAGYFASLVKDEPIRSYASMEEDIYNYEETSKLYYADNKFISDVRSDLHREEIKLEDVSDTLINAVIATEDEYFYEHKGVVPKAIIRAVAQEAANSDVKTGGSTLTQQLIKNQILTNEVSFTRKAKEILLALRLERLFEKEQILEAYLNIIPYGREASGYNIAGVQTASRGIFNVNADEVNLPQAAYLAGLPQSPSAYTPFVNSGGLKDKDALKPGIKRMKTVLKRMYEAEYIDKKEYEEALAYDITADFSEVSDTRGDQHSYLTYELENEAKKIFKKQLAEEDGYKEKDLRQDKELDEEYSTQAERELRLGGYNIHSTIDKNIYKKFQEIAKNYQYYGPDQTITVKDDETGKTKEVVAQVETGGILIDNHTGRIISFVGGREYSPDSELNHATNAYRQNGSTMKPFFYAAAMEKGVVQPGTPIADIPTTYSGGKEITNYGGGYHGIVPARTALAQSYNIPAVRTYMEIINDNPAEEYLDKMKFTRLTEMDYQIESLILGAMDKGVSVKENTNAFATFGNDGQFVDAYMIEKITTNDGDIVYEHESKPVEVYSPQSAYLTIDMMRSVINEGTGSYLNSQLSHGGVDWAGKTGTTNDYKDAWFVGTNPNVTFGTWIGYDNNLGLDYCPGCSLSYSQRNLKLWAELINSASEINPDLVAPQNKFERPDGIVEKSYCAISGMLPSELCEKAGLVKTDLFNSKFVPTEVDDSLITGSYVNVDGKSVVAGSKTPTEFIQGDGLTFNPEFLKRNGYDKLSDQSLLFPQLNRDLWDKISIPKGEIGTPLSDNGGVPEAPQSVSASNSSISWSQSSGHNVVGYRVFTASHSGGNFKFSGSTTGTSLSISGNSGAFYVKAVNYFGVESKASYEVVVGNSKGNEDQDTDKVEDSGKEKKKDKGNDRKKDKKKDENNENDKEKDKDKAKNKDNKKKKDKTKEKNKDKDKKNDEKKDQEKEKDKSKEKDKDKDKSKEKDKDKNKEKDKEKKKNNIQDSNKPKDDED